MPSRIDFPLKNCEGCGFTMRRKRYRESGRLRLEKPAQYAARLTCSHKCRALMWSKRYAESVRTLDGSAVCSRCSAPCTLLPRRTRCDRCRAIGGAKARAMYLRRKWSEAA